MARNGYTITIPDVTDTYFTFEYSNVDKFVTVNEQQSSNMFKGLSGAIHGGEANLDGANLIWNFPDATDVSVKHLTGHLVAPNATVQINCREDGSIVTGGNLRAMSLPGTPLPAARLTSIPTTGSNPPSPWMYPWKSSG